MKKRKIIFGVLSLLWCVMIFTYSAMDDTNSEMRSYFVGRVIYRTFHPDFVQLDTVTQNELVMGIDHYVRKGAHMAEFAVLAVLLFGTVLPPLKEIGKREIFMNALLAFVLAVFYAATDEFHQLFVPGRAGMLRDVCIDSCGILIGLLGCMAYTVIRKKQCRGIKYE